MPVLASFAFAKSPTFAVPRSRFAALAANWNHTVVDSCANPFVLLQTTSGYRVVIGLHEWVYNWSDKTARLEDVFSDFYLLAPGSHTPQYAYTWSVDWNQDTLSHLPVVNVVATGDPWHRYLYLPLPKPPPSYWDTLADNGYPACFQHDY